MQDFSLIPFFEKYLAPDEPFILGCSTGGDSMFLLYKILETPYRKNLIAAYFNHHTRCQCEEEEWFLQEFGRKEDFRVEAGGYDFKIPKDGPSKSFEECAREKRYEFFSGLKEKYGAKKILLAHHFDDRVETMMFNMLRGTKLTGLINMQEESCDILRPLLGLHKKDIHDYLIENDCVFYEDRTNAGSDFTRNFIRNEIVTKFEDVHPEYRKNMSKLIRYFEEAQRFLDLQVQVFLGNSDVFQIIAFRDQDVFIQKEIIKKIYFLRNNHGTIGLSEGNIAEILRFIDEKKGTGIKQIHNLKLKKEKGNIYF